MKNSSIIKNRARKGYTVVEVLVVSLIIASVAGPAFYFTVFKPYFDAKKATSEFSEQYDVTVLKSDTTSRLVPIEKDNASEMILKKGNTVSSCLVTFKDSNKYEVKCLIDGKDVILKPTTDKDSLS